MEKEAAASAGGGIGFLGALTLIFIVLKLTHFIDWSWWWILSPLWLPMSIVIGIFVIGIFVIGMAGWIVK